MRRRRAIAFCQAPQVLFESWIGDLARRRPKHNGVITTSRNSSRGFLDDKAGPNSNCDLAIIASVLKSTLSRAASICTTSLIDVRFTGGRINSPLLAFPFPHSWLPDCEIQSSTSNVEHQRLSAFSSFKLRLRRIGLGQFVHSDLFRTSTFALRISLAYGVRSGAPCVFLARKRTIASWWNYSIASPITLAKTKIILSPRRDDAPNPFSRYPSAIDRVRADVDGHCNVALNVEHCPQIGFESPLHKQCGCSGPRVCGSCANEVEIIVLAPAREHYRVISQRFRRGRKRDQTTDLPATAGKLSRRVTTAVAATRPPQHTRLLMHRSRL